MTRKDYVLLAEAIRRGRAMILDKPTGNASMIAGANVIAREVCADLARDNGRFESDRFLKACGIV